MIHFTWLPTLSLLKDLKNILICTYIIVVAHLIPPLEDIHIPSFLSVQE